MTCRFLFSQGLRKMMARTSTSAKQLSEGSGVSIRQIKRLIEGECFPATDKVVRGIANYFQCEESDILAFGFGLMGE